MYILGALSRISTQPVLDSIRQCLKPDGSYSCFPRSSESDLRFVYSALSVSKLLGDFSQVNKAKTL